MHTNHYCPCAGSVPDVPCCDICDASVFNQCRPGVRARPSKKTKLPDRGKQDIAATLALEDWRKYIFTRDHSNSQLDPSSILDDTTIKSLTTLGNLTRPQLTSLLAESWIWWPRYGHELIAHVTSLKIEYATIPKKNTVAPTKRCAEDDLAATSGKRTRTQRIGDDVVGVDSAVSSYIMAVASMPS